MREPFSKHEFHPMQLTPVSCVVCGQPIEHENHKGKINPKNGISTALKRPEWKVYDDEPERPSCGHEGYLDDCPACVDYWQD